MKKLNLFFALVLGLFIISCGNNEKTGESHDQDTAVTEEHDHSVTDSESDQDQTTTKVVAAAQKDASGKWIANAETTIGISLMVKKIERTLKVNEGKIDIKTYRQMNAKLQKYMDDIFKKCTMTGEAHEELHTFLLPMVDMIKTLGEKGDDECIKAVSDLKSHLDTYNNIFAG